MSNLLEKASIILTPTAYNNGEALCVKPSDGSGDFDFSRNSAATRVNAQGLVENVQILSSNLVVNGDFATDSDWNKDANWSIANGVATSTGGGRMFQSIPFLETNVGTKVKVSFDITERTSGGVQINCYGAASQVYTDVGTHTFIGTTTNTLNLYINNSGEGNLVGSIDNVSVIEITDDTNLPRINYEGFSYDGSGNVVPDSGCGSWLFEPQSTNLITYSEDFSQSYWTKQAGITATYNTTETLSPDGTYNATKFVGNGTTGVLKTSISVSGVVSRSVYLKSVTGITTATFKEPNTNVPSPITLTITNEWQRFEMIGDNGSSFQGLQIDDITSDGIYMWGAQLENQSYATSYIPTDGTTVTRNQDVCTNGGSLASINSLEGVLYFETAALFGGSGAQISLSDGTNDNSVKLRFDLTSNRFTGFIRGNGGITASKTVISSPQTDNNKFALVWNATNLRIWINGVETGTVATNDLPVGLDTLNFSSNTGLLNYYGKTKAVAVYKEALSDQELTELTTI